MIKLMKAGPYRYIDWGGPRNAPLVHFAHGNGYPPGTYTPFIQELTTHYRVIGLEFFGSDFPIQPRLLKHWQQLAEQLKHFFEAGSFFPSILLGHSSGATITLYLATDYAASSVVLLDPIVFSREFLAIWNIFKKIFRLKSILLARSARKKKDTWSTYQEIEDYYHLKPLFKTWTEESFQSYLSAAIAKNNDDTYSLRYPKELEARVYDTVPMYFWSEINQVLAQSVIILRGSDSTTFTNRALGQLTQQFPQAKTKCFQNLTHYLPMEEPVNLGNYILTLLSNIQGNEGSTADTKQIRSPF
ncbi:alpha/beta hydrolase [candidate division CSSED10-310 bacterium]|uniref:Alpha/beta hydrolase n=1 Tax=candidate division CSSED10-310 bacterium TaxID=2855610 RepID=A0ABV6YZ39_UNCC1